MTGMWRSVPLLGLISTLLGSRIGRGVAYVVLATAVVLYARHAWRSQGAQVVRDKVAVDAAADTAERLGRVMAAVRRAEGLHDLPKAERRRRLAEEFSR